MHPFLQTRIIANIIYQDDWYEVSEERDVTTSVPVRLEITITQVRFMVIVYQ